MRPLAIGLWLAAATTPGWAQDTPNHARNLAATCFTCHGTDGRSVGGVPPALAGRSREYLLQTLMDFKTGRRQATIMHQQAKGYSDEQLAIISGYFASVPSGQPAPAPAARRGY